ncbi:carbamoyl-phosphate synthase large subunit, partial [Clostridium perfringens]|nr:carbamoyl-phosphate synthase large subunit [Clostridium perfringens]
VSKVPIVDLATKVMIGNKLRDLGYGVDIYPEPELVSVKVPVFSTQKLPKVEVSLGPEMKSTGEVLGVGRDVLEALYKGFVGGSMYPANRKGKILATINKHDKEEFLPIAEMLSDVGYKFVATKGTAKLLRDAGIDAEEVRKLNEETPNILDMVKNKEVDLVVNTPTKGNDSKRDGFLIRRAAGERNIGVITALDTLKAIAEGKVAGIDKKDLEVFNIVE